MIRVLFTVEANIKLFYERIKRSVNHHRAPVHLESNPGKDWPGSISS